MQPQTYARFALPYEHWNRSSKVKHMRLVKLLLSNLQKHCIDSAQSVRQEHSRLDQTSSQVEKGETLLHMRIACHLVTMETRFMICGAAGARRHAPIVL